MNTGYNNSALIQDEVLVNVALVMDGFYPAGPNFTASLGALIEAVVLHEDVYIEPMAFVIEESDDPGYVSTVIRQSEFIQNLVRDGLLKRFPNQESIEKSLQLDSAGYDYADFITDYFWTNRTFISEPDLIETQFLWLTYLLNNVPTIFNKLTLVDADDVAVGPESNFLLSRGIKTDSLILLETMNRRCNAVVSLAQALNLHPYPETSFIAHQIGAVERSNHTARSVYNEIRSQLSEFDLDDRVGSSSYTSIIVPPLCQIALERAKDSKKALSDEIIGLRYKHRRLREYMSDYERQWSNAPTIKDRLRLDNEFKNGWNLVVKDIREPASRKHMILWEVLKEIGKAPVVIVDKLLLHSRVRNQVKGLHAFWDELLNVAPARHNAQILARLFDDVVDENIWKAASVFGTAVNSFINSA